MSENQTEITRRAIMKRFLRTLVWIDDEIRPDESGILGNPFRSFFYPIAKEFQKLELLVHLHAYDSDSASGEDNMFDDKESNSLRSAVNLAKKADVIILDWHLGRKDPEHSIQLIKELNNESAICYIIVMSAFADDFEPELKKANLLSIDSENSIESHIFQRKGAGWANSNGINIIVMSKPDFQSYSADVFSNSILVAIFDLMLKAYPDYLHWAAIEIAAKLRHSIPRWIQAIPRETDLAVLSELMSDKTEARDFIPEHLLEDLSHMAKLRLLDSLDSANCKHEHWNNKPYDIKAVDTNSARSKKFVHLSCSAEKLEKKDVELIRKESAGDESSKFFIISQQAFTEFCESVGGALETFPTFGAVYVREQVVDSVVDSDDKGRRNAYLCLSQECDSLRSDTLLLLEGSINHGSSNKDGITLLSLRGKVFGFLPEAQSLLSITVAKPDSGGGGRRLDGFQKIGQLRKATARRILSRFWNHLSRSAVNLSRFTLKDRDGG